MTIRLSPPPKDTEVTVQLFRRPEGRTSGLELVWTRRMTVAEAEAHRGPGRVVAIDY